MIIYILVINMSNEMKIRIKELINNDKEISKKIVLFLICL